MCVKWLLRTWFVLCGIQITFKTYYLSISSLKKKKKHEKLFETALLEEEKYLKISERTEQHSNLEKNI